MSATGASLSGTERRRNAIPRLGGRPVGHARKLIGCESKSRSGESSPKNFGGGVEAQIELVNKRFGKRSVGGFGRMGHGPRYLFSGFIYCGLCDSKMIIVSGNGRRGYVKYGCPSHRYRGVCENAMMIRRDRLEEQLLTGLGETRSESGDDQLRFRPFSG
jgi:hypothetical protein